MSENLDTALKAPHSVPLQVCLAVGGGRGGQDPGLKSIVCSCLGSCKEADKQSGVPGHREAWRLFVPTVCGAECVLARCVLWALPVSCHRGATS